MLLRFSLSRCSSSCHLAARCYRLSLLASLSTSSHHRLFLLALSSCSRRLRPPPTPMSVCSFPVFSCGFLSFFSTFLRLAGRGVLCLLASFVAALVPSLRLSSRAPCACRCALVRFLRRLLPIFSCGSSPLCPCRRLARASSPPLFVFSPRSSTSVGGAMGGSFFACLLVVRAAGGGGGMLCLVYGCRCLYI